MVRFTENHRLVLNPFGHLAVVDTFLTILPLMHFFGFKIESPNPAISWVRLAITGTKARVSVNSLSFLFFAFQLQQHLVSV
jgi:hypothetical protein